MTYLNAKKYIFSLPANEPCDEKRLSVLIEKCGLQTRRIKYVRLAGSNGKTVCAEMLMSVGYRGFANFDLRLDARDGRLYLLELNLRPGRSNWFLTAVGASPAELLARDYILGESIPPFDASADVLFRTVPYAVLRRYIQEDRLAAEAERLHRAERDACPWYSPADLRDVRRLFYVAAHMYREGKKFRRYLTPVRK